MKHSIRKQFACIFIGMMIATVGFCWLVNILFLEKFYTIEKQSDLLEVYERIDDAVAQGYFNTPEFFQTTLSNLCGRYNIDGLVADVRTQEIRAFGADQEQSTLQLWDSLLFVSREADEYLLDTKDLKMTVVRDSRTNMDYLELWGNLKNGDVFLLRTALEGIRDSARIANQFLAYVGIGASLTSGILIWLLTGKYTRPLMDLVKISDRVARLDFEAKYEGETFDEIGMLGANLNHMSAELEKTISELKTANNELTRDIQQKNRRDEIRTEFLSNVSHELKTPLALIRGYAEGLRDGIKEDAEEQDFYCSVIVDEAKKMNELVNKLLNLNQLESGSEPVTMERFDLVALVRTFLASTKLIADQNDVTVVWDNKESVFVWGDQFLVEEVFRNYFSNAMNHVEADEEGSKRIEVTITEEDKNVRITVFNTGNRIPEDSLPRLWDKFYKVDKARTRAYGGSGVGLSIVKASMESLGRSFGAENRENGVAFWFELEQA